MLYDAKKLRTQVKFFTNSIERVENYRKDILSSDDLSLLSRSKEILKEIPTQSASAMRESFNEIDKILRKIGHGIYDVDFLTENCDVFLFASILAIAIRTFFLQPFKIPTNSMYPTFNGMTHELCVKSPSIAERFCKYIQLGSSHFEIKSPVSGEIQIPIATKEDKLSQFGGVLYYRVVRERSWILFSKEVREYTFLVNGNPAKIRVPLEFHFDDVALETFYPKAKSWAEVLHNQPFSKFQRIKISSNVEEDRITYFNSGIIKLKDQYLFNFNLLTGDMLFVDKISYNFRTPRVGEAFVFRTRALESLNYDDKYYIKRLVGDSGDILSIRNSTLYRNRKPIEGNEAFELNRKKINNYPGYTAEGVMKGGDEVIVSERSYFAMGDNSPHSFDSRFWGEVPYSEVVGRPLFILYPFSFRWGRIK